MSPSAAQPFDPARYLTKVNGNDYLEVKWRLVWLRHKHPDAIIETDALHLDEHGSIFRARITIPSGGSATGHGSETSADFRDYYEKAETKAIGRALAALGFGTQFCQDHASSSPPPDDEPAPIGQLKYLQTVAAKAGLSDDALDEHAIALFGVPHHGLSRRDAAHLAQIIRDAKTPTASQQPTPPRHLSAVVNGVFTP